MPENNRSDIARDIMNLVEACLRILEVLERIFFRKQDLLQCRQHPHTLLNTLITTQTQTNI